MSKRRKPIEDEDDDVESDRGQPSCTSLDHAFPQNLPNGGTLAGTSCYCGKRYWMPLIPLGEDDYLKKGMIIQLHKGDFSTLHEVVMVNQSRAYCWPVTPKEALAALTGKRKLPVFMPMPGSAAWRDAEEAGTVESGEAEDRRAVTDGGINITPRSVAKRVSRAEIEEMLAQSNRRSDMATKAGLPVAQTRAQKLAQKPKGSARPLTGAAAKAKANAKPKAPKTVRPCGCGCGEETTAYFAPGHDARFKGWLKKVADGRITIDELKKLMGQKTFSKYAFKKKGAGFVTSVTYQEAAEA